MTRAELVDTWLPPGDGELPGDLTFIGFVGIVHPPAPGVKETVAIFRFPMGAVGVGESRTGHAV